MAHKVGVNAGQVQIVLPDGEVYGGPVDVILTDAQFARIRPALFPTVLTDLGTLPDPYIDAEFATDDDLAAGLGIKQDAATAATDAELATGLGAKQDAATAATDAELAAQLADVVRKPASPTTIANPAAPGTLYAQADAAATRNALVSVLGVLRTAGLIT